MANVSRVNGFRPIGHTNGAPWNGQVNKYAILAADGTATFVGDLVKLSGTADADGVASVAQVAAGNTPIGPIVWIEPDGDDLTQVHRLASTLRYVYVADSPDLVMEAQEDAVGGALAITNVGQNADVIVGAGSTTTGQSGMQIDSSTANTTSTLVLRILGFIQRVDNEVGVANAKMKVAFNVHQYGSVGTTGV